MSTKKRTITLTEEEHSALIVVGQMMIDDADRNQGRRDGALESAVEKLRAAERAPAIADAADDLANVLDTLIRRAMRSGRSTR